MFNVIGGNWVALTLMLLPVGWAGCAAELERDPLDYEAARVVAEDGGPSCDVQRVFSQSCGGLGCHGPSVSAAGLDLESPGADARTLNVAATHQHITDGTEASCLAGELLIDANNPEESVLLKKVEGRQSCGGEMPLARTFSSADLDCLRQWVYEVAGKSPPP